MTEIFRQCIGKFVHVYLGDIFVFSYSTEEHENHLGTAFNILQEQKLYLSTQTVDLYSEQMDCLRHLIDCRSLRADGDLRQTTWYEYPPRSNYSIWYVEGLRNVVANMLSQMHAGHNMGIPIDNWVNVDIQLNPEGETLPVDQLLESCAMQPKSRVQKPSSTVPRDAMEPRIKESNLTQNHLQRLTQHIWVGLQACKQLAGPCRHAGIIYSE